MIQQQTDLYIKACMKTWLICESCIHVEVTGATQRNNLIRECRECAQSCFAVVCKLISQAEDLGDLVFNCILHCRQCYDECEKYEEIDDDIQYCGSVCSICAETLKDLAVFQLN
jgi:hypothetical protein